MKFDKKQLKIYSNAMNLVQSSSIKSGSLVITSKSK